jgi:hypothetical protein
MFAFHYPRFWWISKGGFILVEQGFRFKMCDVFKHQLVIAIAERGVYLSVAVHWD